MAVIGTASAERLDRVGHGAVQLQERIAGLDVRVHVVGERWFATSVSTAATRLLALTKSLALLVAGVDLRLSVTPLGVRTTTCCRMVP